VLHPPLPPVAPNHADALAPFCAAVDMWQGIFMRRPFIQFDLSQLRALFEARGRENAVLELLQYELSFRNTAGSRQLLAEVLQRIEELAYPPAIRRLHPFMPSPTSAHSSCLARSRRLD
jgi:hypothetical protein